MKLTPDDHQRIAAELVDIRARLQAVAVEVSAAFPPSGGRSRFPSLLGVALARLDSARIWGDAAYAATYPNMHDPNAYFPEETR